MNKELIEKYKEIIESDMVDIDELKTHTLIDIAESFILIYNKFCIFVDVSYFSDSYKDLLSKKRLYEMKTNIGKQIRRQRFEDLVLHDPKIKELVGFVSNEIN